MCGGRKAGISLSILDPYTFSTGLTSVFSRWCFTTSSKAIMSRCLGLTSLGSLNRQRTIQKWDSRLISDIILWFSGCVPCLIIGAKLGAQNDIFNATATVPTAFVPPSSTSTQSSEAHIQVPIKTRYACIFFSLWAFWGLPCRR